MKRLRVPTVASSKTLDLDPSLKGFPVPHYSYSSLSKLCTNPFMFKVNAMNGDYLETAPSASNVLGRAGHLGMKDYIEAVMAGKDEGEATRIAHDSGQQVIKATSDGMVEFNSAIEDREKLNQRYAFSIFGYIREYDIRKRAKQVLMVERVLIHKVIVNGREMPVPLKGVPDVVYRDHQGRVIVEDHKFTSRHSDDEEIDGAKLLQAAFMYMLVHAELGEAPYSMIFREFKTSENRPKPGEPQRPQTREYEIVFADHPIIFDFFFRLYEDATNAILGHQVFLPNLHAVYDREVSILAYAHRLDVNEERDRTFHKLKVDNLTDALKLQIQREGAEKKYLETVTRKFVSAKSLNYKDMTIEERIRMKLAEHGIAIEFHSKVEGLSVVRYLYEPSIGLKMSRVESFEKDVEQAVGASGVRILAPVPDTELIGFEVPRKDRQFAGPPPAATIESLPIGVDVNGSAVSVNLREAPHLLIAGATGSGKSVAMNNMIESLLGKAAVYLVDPKMVEFYPYAARASGYADTVDGARSIIQGLVDTMESRYAFMKKNHVRDIADAEGDNPIIALFVDEYNDLALVEKSEAKRAKRAVSLEMEGKRVEAREKAKLRAIKKSSPLASVLFANADDATLEAPKEPPTIPDMIVRLAQKGRAAGIHVILATQRPSVDVISGVIKANFPMRLAFRTATSTDSNVIVDDAGAEKLLGKGDMLAMLPGERGLKRLQGYSPV